MATARRMALTASVATTIVLSIAGAAWGIGIATTGSTPRATGVSAPESMEAEMTARGGGGQGNGGGHGNESAGGGQGMGNGNGNGSGAHTGTEGAEHAEDLPAAVPGAEVTAATRQQLLYLVEEEKLAGDVYELATATYGARVFTNIARAEDTHADEVRVLLDRYAIEDPTVGAAAGEFTDQELQDLYDQLAPQVTSSWAEAVAAGILIEQTDIADLQELLAEDLPADVQAVAENLLAGSQRHLAAFQRQAA